MGFSIANVLSNVWPHLHATSASDAVFWTENELVRDVSDDLKRLAEDYGMFIVRDVGTLLIQGTARYSAPARHLSTLYVSANNVPLIASGTKELEALDETFETTQATTTKPVKRWYSDKVGVNQIGMQPVPAAADAGHAVEVIFHQYPCVDELGDTITAPLIIGDYLELKAVKDAYLRESDGEMPEVAKTADGLAQLYEAMFAGYFGASQ